MKTRYLIALIAALAVTSTAFSADDGEALFNKGKCAACHKLNDKTVGPTLKEIAAKYAGDKDVVATLEKKVRAGGVGVWGKMPMPRTPAGVTDAEITTIVAWMLAH
jgi:cytochrome c